ncbi:MAG: cupin domain-containing protein [Candidatus Promineifilaceae bacterium]|nr:cupin domain-containing protein [Candidatus Promineifilaceae bacterium]
MTAGEAPESPFYVADLTGLLPEIPAESIVSRAVHVAGQMRVTLFGFAPGQELTEHTAARPAVLHFLSGQAELTLGTEVKAAGPGAWVYMPAHLPHSIVAQTEVVMLLLLLPDAAT